MLEPKEWKPDWPSMSMQIMLGTKCHAVQSQGS
jgi:hypothetical protein